MFDWLRRSKRFETPEEARAALRRQLPGSPFQPTDPAVIATVVDTFQSHAGPSDGGAAHHSGACHTDVAASLGCDGGSFSHH